MSNKKQTKKKKVSEPNSWLKSQNFIDQVKTTKKKKIIIEFTVLLTAFYTCQKIILNYSILYWKKSSDFGWEGVALFFKAESLYLVSPNTSGFLKHPPSYWTSVYQMNLFKTEVGHVWDESLSTFPFKYFFKLGDEQSGAMYWLEKCFTAGLVLQGVL